VGVEFTMYTVIRLTLIYGSRYPPLFSRGKEYTSSRYGWLVSVLLR
jgi:hypothetical protein